MQNYEKNGNPAKGLQNFQFEGKEVRVVIEKNNVLLFVAVDVCNILGYTNLSQTLKRLGDDGVISNYPIPDKVGRNQPTNMLTEQGLESLISGSKKAEASRFGEWIKNRIIGFIQSPFSQSADFQAFAFNDYLVRLIFDEQGRLWFVASDVCKALGYVKSASAIVEQHCHAKGCTKMVHPSKGGGQEMLLITEGNLYRLITKSSKPEAIKFEEWVFDEVLPTIRKTGMYQVPTKQDEHFDEEENAFTMEGATLKLNYEVAVATRFIKVINDSLDDRLRSFKNFELREIVSQLHAGQHNMEKRLMGYIEDIINIIGMEKLEKNTPVPVLSYVYLIQKLDVPWLKKGLLMCKVGKGNNPDERKFELEAGGSELSVLCRIGFPTEELAFAWERVIQETFDTFHYKREWFLLGEKQVEFFLGLARLTTILYEM